MDSQRVTSASRSKIRPSTLLRREQAVTFPSTSVNCACQGMPSYSGCSTISRPLCPATLKSSKRLAKSFVYTEQHPSAFWTVARLRESMHVLQQCTRGDLELIGPVLQLFAGILKLRSNFAGASHCAIKLIQRRIGFQTMSDSGAEPIHLLQPLGNLLQHPHHLPVG